MIYPTDRIARVLSNWSSLAENEHWHDAWAIYRAQMDRLERPLETAERAERIRRAAAEIANAMSLMSSKEKISFTEGFVDNLGLPSHTKIVFALEGYANLPWYVNALRSAATTMRRRAEQDMAAHAPAKNENRVNVEIAKRVADVYARITGKEPPAAGVTGPFQRLLSDVYDALDRPGVDLRGPLYKVHEYRKDRHSCD